MLNAKNILVTTDGSEIAESAFHFAEILARQQGATLHLLYVEDFSPMLAYASDFPATVPPTEWMEGISKDDEIRLIDTATKLAERSSLRVIPHFKEGTPAAQIVACAKQVSADCIVMSTHGRSGIKRLLFGSVTERVLRSSTCPVLCVKPGETPFQAGPVLLATDLSTESLTAVPFATTLAKQQDCELHLVLVLEDQLYISPDGMLPPVPVEWMVKVHQSMEKQLHQLAADIHERVGIIVVPHVRHGKTAKEINSAAAEVKAGCLVVATHGRTGLRRIMLGSVAEDIIRSSKCPILAVRAPSVKGEQAEVAAGKRMQAH
jgi:nucleotide-binding universal stress UspA family protein